MNGLTPDDLPLGAAPGPEVMLAGRAAHLFAPDFDRALRAEGYRLGQVFGDATGMLTDLRKTLDAPPPPGFAQYVLTYGGVDLRFGREEDRTLDVPTFVRGHVETSLVVYVPTGQQSADEQWQYMKEGYSAVVEYHSRIDCLTMSAARMLTALAAGPQRVIYPL